MKKKKRIIAGIIIALVILLGVKILTQPTQKERQIAFLKEHEDEMTNYVKSMKSEVQNVQYYWEDIRIGNIGNGLPFGGGKRALIFGFANNDSNMDFRLDIDIDTKGTPMMSTMHFGQQIKW